jgi:hypothetical protein
MTTIDIPEEALAIAREGARADGSSVHDWLIRAINVQAAAQEPTVEIPFDDCGFYSPHSRVA